MPCWIIVLIENDDFNDKKNSGSIVLGDYVEKFEVIKPCFLCVRDSRDRTQYYTNKNWPLWEELMPCKERNVINDSLVDRDRVLFPPMRIKLGLIKQFTKARMVTASLTCARLFQDWPWRSWKLASLTVLRSGSSSEIHSSKTQWTKWNWKR